MNTVFKFWYQSWVVLGVGAAVVLVEEFTSRHGLRRTSAVLVGLATVTLAPFWVMAVPARLDDRLSTDGWSLDGESYLRTDPVQGDQATRFVLSDDEPLIDWLRANVRGIHPVAEAPGVDYQWSGRISWSTGLPTPIGWAYHERQQRRTYEPWIDTRVADLTTLYTTTDEREMARVLATYSIAYVVFGTQEHLLASAASAVALRAFECLEVGREADRALESTVEAHAYFVARVDQPCVKRLRPLPSPPPPPS